MLKVKEGIELEELEKYGFRRSKWGEFWSIEKRTGYDSRGEAIMIYEDDRKIEIDLYNHCYMTHDAFKLQDTLYDLIQAGIVVKE